MGVDRNRTRKEKVADSKISGYVRTEPYVMSKGAMAMGFSDPVHTTPEKKCIKCFPSTLRKPEVFKNASIAAH